MFVRFKENLLRTGDRSLQVEVVQSYRCEMTRAPRSRSIAYLGTVREKHIRFPVFRKWFWQQVDAKLANLQLSEQEIDTLKEEIALRIPRAA